MKLKQYFLTYGGFCRRKFGPDEYGDMKCPFKSGHPHHLKVHLLSRRLKSKTGKRKTVLKSVGVVILNNRRKEVFRSVVPWY